MSYVEPPSFNTNETFSQATEVPPPFPGPSVEPLGYEPLPAASNEPERRSPATLLEPLPLAKVPIEAGSPAVLQVSLPTGENAPNTSVEGSAPHGGPQIALARSPSVKISIPKSSDFEDAEQFNKKQRAQIRENVLKAGGQKVLMLSHSWRDTQTQLRKRKIISTLSLNGWSFWADFLDLQATGPVPWRKEIEEGIRDCAKVVIFADKAYLLSFNCLQEVAFALQYSKPIVVLLLEQAAMDLLTRPTGVRDAWVELRAFENKPLTPGMGDEGPLTEKMVSRLFERLSAVNFCMCRPLDFDNDSEALVLRRVLEFTGAELAYQKEHALLQSKAMEWEKHDRDHRRLPVTTAAADYRAWIRQAREGDKLPAPTQLQDDFIAAAEGRARSKRRILQACVVLALLALAGLAIFGFVNASEANRQRSNAVDAANAAERAAEAEAVARSNAELQRAIAENATVAAEASATAAQAAAAAEATARQSAEQAAVAEAAARATAEEQTAIAENATVAANAAAAAAEAAAVAEAAARQSAEEQRAIAENATVAAEAAAAEALAARDRADLEAAVATGRQYLFVSKSDASHDAFTQAALRESLLIAEQAAPARRALPADAGGARAAAEGGGRGGAGRRAGEALAVPDAVRRSVYEEVALSGGALALQTVAYPTLFIGGAGGHMAGAVSGDGQWAAAAGAGGEGVWVHEIDGGSASELQGLPPTDGSAAWAVQAIGWEASGPQAAPSAVLVAVLSVSEASLRVYKAALPSSGSGAQLQATMAAEHSTASLVDLQAPETRVAWSAFGDTGVALRVGFLERAGAELEGFDVLAVEFGVTTEAVTEAYRVTEFWLDGASFCNGMSEDGAAAKEEGGFLVLACNTQMGTHVEIHRLGAGNALLTAQAPVRLHDFRFSYDVALAPGAAMAAFRLYNGEVRTYPVDFDAAQGEGVAFPSATVLGTGARPPQSTGVIGSSIEELIAFSPDAQWLATCLGQQGCELRKTDGPGEAVAMAVDAAPGRVRWLDATRVVVFPLSDSAAVVVQLEGPWALLPRLARFSPLSMLQWNNAGTRLLQATQYSLWTSDAALDTVEESAVSGGYCRGGWSPDDSRFVVCTSNSAEPERLEVVDAVSLGVDLTLELERLGPAVYRAMEAAFIGTGAEVAVACTACRSAEAAGVQVGLWDVAAHSACVDGGGVCTATDFLSWLPDVAALSSNAEVVGSPMSSCSSSVVVVAAADPLQEVQAGPGVVAVFDVSGGGVLTYAAATVSTAAMDPTQQRLLLAGERMGVLDVCGAALDFHPLEHPESGSGHYTGVAWLPDGSGFFSIWQDGNLEGTLRQWEVSAGCVMSWVVNRGLANLRGTSVTELTTFDMSLRVVEEDGEQRSEVVVVETDQEFFTSTLNFVSDTQSVARNMRRQSMGISKAAVDAHFGLENQEQCTGLLPA